jgi:hypothetical protein
MREVPMMRVEVNGTVEHRPGVLDVLQYDSTGKPTLSRMRPQLLPGETLIEREGQIPAIAGAGMKHVSDMLRHQLIRAVTGEHPAVLVKEADPVALNCLCHRLADAAEAARLLCANGYGWPAQSLTDMVRTSLGLTAEAPE